MVARDQHNEGYQSMHEVRASESQLPAPGHP